MDNSRSLSRERQQIQVKYQGIRLDYYLADVFHGQSRNYLQRLIRDGFVLLNGIRAGKDDRLKQDDWIDINWPDQGQELLLPDPSIKLNVLYEDRDILILNKQAGLIIHPGAGNPRQTLVNALLSYDFNRFSAMIDEETRPGIVHRLDKETSGVMVVAKHNSIRMRLISMFKANQIEKTYLALLHGKPQPATGEISTLIGRSHVDRKKMAVVSRNGKTAKTRYTVLSVKDGYSLAKLTPATGRTHQLRVHMAYSGYPVIGDSTYKYKKKIKTSGRQTNATCLEN